MTIIINRCSGHEERRLNANITRMYGLWALQKDIWLLEYATLNCPLLSGIESSNPNIWTFGRFDCPLVAIKRQRVLRKVDVTVRIRRYAV